MESAIKEKDCVMQCLPMESFSVDSHTHIRYCNVMLQRAFWRFPYFEWRTTWRTTQFVRRSIITVLFSEWLAIHCVNIVACFLASGSIHYIPNISDSSSEQVSSIGIFDARLWYGYTLSVVNTDGCWMHIWKVSTYVGGRRSPRTFFILFNIVSVLFGVSLLEKVSPHCAIQHV